MTGKAAARRPLVQQRPSRGWRCTLGAVRPGLLGAACSVQAGAPQHGAVLSGLPSGLPSRGSCP
jgi:hypothetical protein